LCDIRSRLGLLALMMSGVGGKGNFERVGHAEIAPGPSDKKRVEMREGAGRGAGSGR
jgi:hypothetical protein